MGRLAVPWRAPRLTKLPGARVGELLFVLKHVSCSDLLVYCLGLLAPGAWTTSSVQALIYARRKGVSVPRSAFPIETHSA